MDKCTTCGCEVPPLEVFPGPQCIGCWADAPEGRYVPTANELVTLWGGPVRRKRR